MPTYTAFPSCYVDGDSISWTETLADYTSGAGVTVVYRVAGPEQFTVSGSGSGTSWTFTLPTGKLPGDYNWQKVGTSATVVTTLACGHVKIKPNLSTTAATSDAETMLATAVAAYTSLVAGKIESASVNGESYTYARRTELLAQIQQLKATVQAEQDALKLQQGLSTGRRILTRLSRW